MAINKVIPLSALFFLLIILIALFFKNPSEKKISSAREALFLESATDSDEPLETTDIILFFLSEGDDLLHPEDRKIFANPQVVHQAKLVIEELIKGSRYGSVSPIPLATTLRQLYVTQAGVAYVDFSREIQENHLSGSAAEISTIYAIVNSLTYNFKSIKRVFILIDGGERETLSGHIDLRRPFLPKNDLIAN